MSVVETILVYGAIPLAIVLFFAVLTLIPGRTKKARYKPGQSWEYPPVWWEPHPHGPAAGNHDSDPKAIGSSVYQEPGGTGHGHGRELAAGDAHGASASGVAASRPVPVPSGPLGGARGTW